MSYKLESLTNLIITLNTNIMKLRLVERKKAKIKMALQGSSGSGKTFSSILLAKGLTDGDFSKVVLIDSEWGSGNLYAHLGNFNVVTLEPPYTPEKYIKAIDICLDAKMEVIILDGISKIWQYLLEFHASLKGNSFVNWQRVNLKQNAFIDKILQSHVHIIATMRTKQAYVLNLKDGKYVPEKVGLKAIQRNNVDYEFTTVFNLDNQNLATATKDRTGLFTRKQAFVINSATGRKILNWSLNVISIELVRKEILTCTSTEGLKHLYEKYSNYNEQIHPLIIKRKAELDSINSQIIDKEQIVKSTNKQSNGTIKKP
jgi:AAA domain